MFFFWGGGRDGGAGPVLGVNKPKKTAKTSIFYIRVCATIIEEEYHASRRSSPDSFLTFKGQLVSIVSNMSPQLPSTDTHKESDNDS
jgi:hypothetical protein